MNNEEGWDPPSLPLVMWHRRIGGESPQMGTEVRQCGGGTLDDYNTEHDGHWWGGLSAVTAQGQG